MGEVVSHRVFVDANVYYSRTQRDWLGLLYLQGESNAFSVFWTEDVLGELVYHLRRQHPGWAGHRISSIRDRLTGVFENGRVADFPVGQLDEVSDPHDLHVHAAALSCDADILLTNNIKDFSSVQHYDVMAPDEFFCLIDDSLPHVVRAATRDQSAYWGRRDGGADLPDRLRRVGCPRFAARVLAHLRAIAKEPG